MKLRNLLLPMLLFVPDARTQTPTFEQHIRPILKAHCFECHGDMGKPKAKLDVRLARFLLQGGVTGPAIVPGDFQKSLLIERIVSGEMPPGKKKLPAKDLKLIEAWIAAGAKTARPEPQTLALGFQISPEEDAFWSFQPIGKPTPPKQGHPVDAFLLAKLEAKGLKFSPEADRRTLIRRATFDLIGLPPTPQEIEDFVNDAAPNAWEKVIDRLLDSPSYGERWGRHWLDVAGYADSEGYTGDDVPRKSAWRYRDYVIRAFAGDMPWDRFITEQLAGDELVKTPYDKLPPAELDKLIATGFLRMAPDGTATANVDLPASTNQTVADTIQIVGTAFMGLTVHCAQCHNHRYDPIPQDDYYKVRAIFEPTFDWKSWRRPPAREVSFQSAAERKMADDLEKQALAVDKARIDREKIIVQQYLDEQLAKLPKEVQEPLQKAFYIAAAKRTREQAALLAKHPNIAGITSVAVGRRDKKIADELAAFTAQAAKLRAQKPDIGSIRAATEIPGKVPITYFFDRGDHQAPKDRVAPGTLVILAKYKLGEIPADDPSLPTTGRRLAFARWLTHPEHPLTARALVNRFWMHHFGQGLVSTPGDLGLLGDRPTHPELLDWLARDFVSGGWKLKRFHKLVMTSAAYRQTSQRRPDHNAVDPDNKLLGRMPIRRLEAETMRDAMLAVSGKLNTKLYGTPIPIKTDETGQVVLGVNTDDGAGRPTSKIVPLNGEEYRRSLYVTVRRSKPLAILETFDGAMVTPNCECRVPTTVAPQALLLMNGKSVLEQAEFFAKRLQQDAGTDPAQQVRRAYTLALGREASAAEVKGGTAFLAEQAKAFAGSKTLPAGVDAPTAALANFAQALLSSNAFLYVE